MNLKAGQQVHLLFDKNVTGTVSLVRGDRVHVTWHRPLPPFPPGPRVRCSYPAEDASRILARA